MKNIIVVIFLIFQSIHLHPGPSLSCCRHPQEPEKTLSEEIEQEKLSKLLCEALQSSTKTLEKFEVMKTLMKQGADFKSFTFLSENNIFFWSIKRILERFKKELEKEKEDDLAQKVYVFIQETIDPMCGIGGKNSKDSLDETYKNWK